jgi:hypothetical protein
MIQLISCLLVQGNANDVFARIESAHKRLTQFSASVREANTNYQPLFVSVSGTYGRVVLPTQRIVEVKPDLTRFYDQVLDQVAQTKTRTTKSPTKDLISVSMVHREAIGFLLDENIRSSFLTDMRQAKGWKLTGSTHCL